MRKISIHKMSLAELQLLGLQVEHHIREKRIRLVLSGLAQKTEKDGTLKQMEKRLHAAICKKVAVDIDDALDLVEAFLD